MTRCVLVIDIGSVSAAAGFCSRVGFSPSLDPFFCEVIAHC